MKHANRSQPSDCPENFSFGKYWNRHRELDNLLSGAFMFLPEPFRLPQNIQDPVAINTNLNIHAAVICLHNSAYEMANEHSLPAHLKSTIKTRLLSASNEVVNILKLTSHTNAGYVSGLLIIGVCLELTPADPCIFQRGPLIALSFYVACSVYTSQAQEEGVTPIQAANIEFLLTAMEAIGRQNKITLNFLRQAIHELKQAGLDGFVRVPKIPPQATDPLAGEEQPCGQIPLFARSRVSKRTTGILPPLPGRLPLNKPIGIRPQSIRFLESLEKCANIVDPQSLISSYTSKSSDGFAAAKRRRIDMSPEPPATMRLGNNDDNPAWRQHVPIEEVSPSADTPIGSNASSSTSFKNPQETARFNLPHRANSSTRGSSPSVVVIGSSSTSMSSGTSPSQVANGSEPNITNGGTAKTNQVGNSTHAFGVSDSSTTAPGGFRGGVMMDTMFQDYGLQDASPGFTEVTEAMLDDASWMILNDLAVNGQSWDTGEVGAGVG